MTQIPQASAERPAVLEGFLIGAEALSTPGLPVAANKRLRSFLANFKQEANFEQYVASGLWGPSQYVIGGEHASASYSGWGNFCEDHLIFDSILGAPTTATVGTNGVSRIWQPALSAAIDGRTYSIAAGQAARAEKYPCGFFNGHTYTINRGAFGKSGNILSQAALLNTALEGSVSTFALVPILAKNTYVKFASTLAGLTAAVKYRRVFEATLNFAPMYNPINALVDDQISFDGRAQILAPFTLGIQTNALAAAEGLIVNGRNAEYIYWEIGNISPREFEAGQPYSLTFQFATQVSQAFDQATVQDVVGRTFTLGAAPATDMANPIKVTMISDVAV